MAQYIFLMYNLSTAVNKGALREVNCEFGLLKGVEIKVFVAINTDFGGFWSYVLKAC